MGRKGECFVPLPLKIILCAFGLVVVACLITAYVSFRIVFCVSKKHREEQKEEFPIPRGKAYEPYREDMLKWMKQANSLPHTNYSIVSRDGLVLRAKYYEYSPDAPTEILLHGYRGWSFRDLCGGIDRCFRIGHNALIVDNRGAGESEGSIITFGAKERLDCIDWINLTIKNINPNTKLILTGVSMGAATVLSLSCEDLPENVVGVLADCGYTCAKDIIKKVMRELGLPDWLFYPLTRLGALIYGGFDIEKNTPIEAMKTCRLPVIFFHGDEDSLVPHFMSQKNFDACVSSQKRLVTIKGANHCLCFPSEQEQYISELRDFFRPITSKQQ